MAAKLVNLGFGFGPQRNPRSGPLWVSRGGERERKREQGRGGEGKGREGSGYGAASASAAVELLTSIHHCVTKNELERERERGRGCYVHTGCPFLPELRESNGNRGSFGGEMNFSNGVDRTSTDVSGCVEYLPMRRMH